MKRTIVLFLCLTMLLSYVPGILFITRASSAIPEDGDISIEITPDDEVKETTPGGNETESTTPETTVPETTIPETTIPETTVPETTIPETTIPNTSPDTTTPVPETDTKSITGIAVKKGPTKTKYLVGEELDITGLVITVKYSDGTSKDITKGFAVKGFSSKYSGTCTLTVEYKGFAEKVTVTVKKLPTEVASIEIFTFPTKLIYTQGEEFDPSGMVVTVINANGTKRVSEDYTVYADLSSIGTQTVSVIYAGKIATFTIEVLEKIEEATQETTVPEYETEETLDVDEIVTNDDVSKRNKIPDWAIYVGLLVVIIISGYKVISESLEKIRRQ